MREKQINNLVVSDLCNEFPGESQYAYEFALGQAKAVSMKISTKRDGFVGGLFLCKLF